MAASYNPRKRAFDGLIKAPPASASTSAEYLAYDVFINHHGGDVKHTLASGIYNSLDATGLRVFLDKDELKLGDFFPQALEQAMGSASLHIAIFSEKYAESPWCLAELAFMLQTGIKFIPVFYHVEPFTLRWAIEGKGIYADALSNHEIKNRYSSEELQGWKQALHKASFYTGEIINNQGDQEKVVTNVVNRVLKELKKVQLDVAKHPVGLDEAVQDFEEFALQSVGPIQIVGICGMGGAGKTTLAKEFYNKKCSTIDRSSFIFDLREAAKKGLLHKKQKKLLEDLDLDLKGKGADFDNVDTGKEILKSRLRSVSVLIVLDDVDHIDQLDALLPTMESLSHGSLIIVTTRELQVLKAWDISAIYKIRKLNAAHAKELFCWHAFRQPSPLSGFEDLSEKFINACHGLPLSLKVLGGQLYGESCKNYWQSQLDKLCRIVPDDIKLRLKISYDALDKEEKEMFLDIACFFIGYESRKAIAVWDGSGWNGLHGCQRLVNKCLVELECDEQWEANLIRMHDHLRDLGREIANQQSPYRLWFPQQIIEIQPQQEAILIRGMVKAIGDNCYRRQGKIIIHTNQGERSLAPCSLGLKIFVGDGDFIDQEHSELSRELLVLQCYKFEHENLPSWLSLKKLRILELIFPGSLEDLWERDADAPLQLTELIIWGGSSLRGFPRSIARLRNLKKILIGGGFGYNNTLSGLPQEFCHLQSLEHLDMQVCTNLSSLPSNFGDLTNLRHLNLHGCTVLKLLPDSFKKLTLLEYLNLENCCEFTINPKLHILENMTKLGYLNLDGCRKLEELRLPEVASLTKLYLEGTGLKELPATIFQLTMLTELTIGSEFLTTLPTSLGNLSSLTTLKIQGCKEAESLTDSLEHLNFLKDLDIRDTPISELTYGSGCMLKKIVLWSTKVSKISICGDCCPFLETLDLSFNEDLREVETLPATLKSLEVSHCGVLKDIKGVRGLKNLQNLFVKSCDELDRLPCLAELTSLKIFMIEYCPELGLDGLPSLAELTSLNQLNLIKCHKLEKIKYLRSLETLRMDDCSELEGLPGFAELTSLKKFELIRCHKVERIEALESLRSLETLKIKYCSELGGLPCLVELTSLKEFELIQCHKLEKIESLESLRSLETLKIEDCPELEGLPNLAELTSLKEFELIQCHKLEKVKGLESLRSLETLWIQDCPEFKLDGLPSLAELTSLNQLNLIKCHKLEEIEYLRSLEMLRMDDCSELDGLPGFAELTSLKKIELIRCHKVEKIEALESLRSLETLKIEYCSELGGLPSLAELTSLKKFILIHCHKLEKIEGLESLRSLETLKIEDCPELEGLPNLAELTSLKKFELIQCHKLEKIEGLERLTSLEKLQVRGFLKASCRVSLEQCERLKSLVVVGNDVSVVESFISNIHSFISNKQKWPGEVMICTRAVIDAGLQKNFFTSFPLKNVVEFGSFGGLKLRRPESSANANAILICFSIDYVYPKLLFQIRTDRGNLFQTELANGKWVWMGVFPQDSDWLQSNQFEIWASSEDKDVKVKEAWLVMGEEGSIREAFHQLSDRYWNDEKGISWGRENAIADLNTTALGFQNLRLDEYHCLQDNNNHPLDMDKNIPSKGRKRDNMENVKGEEERAKEKNKSPSKGRRWKGKLRCLFPGCVFLHSH